MKLQLRDKQEPLPLPVIRRVIGRGILSVGAGLEGEFAVWPDEAFLVAPDVKTAHNMGS